MLTEMPKALHYTRAYKNYRAENILKIVEEEDKLELTTVVRQDCRHSTRHKLCQRL